MYTKNANSLRIFKSCQAFNFDQLIKFRSEIDKSIRGPKMDKGFEKPENIPKNHYINQQMDKSIKNR